MEEVLPSLRIDPAAPIDPASLFGPQACWLEIGFGAGEHLAWRAQQNPDIGMIGCEMFVNGIASLLTQITREKLGNIRICEGDARLLISQIQSASIDRAFLLFPDPWPKYRHRERRFVNPENLRQMARILKSGAEFIVATDDPIYLLWILHEMQKSPDFLWQAQEPADWSMRDWPITRYEQKALKAGRKGHYLRYRRR